MRSCTSPRTSDRRRNYVNCIFRVRYLYIFVGTLAESWNTFCCQRQFILRCVHFFEFTSCGCRCTICWAVYYFLFYLHLYYYYYHHYDYHSQYFIVISFHFTILNFVMFTLLRSLSTYDYITCLFVYFHWPNCAATYIYNTTSNDILCIDCNDYFIHISYYCITSVIILLNPAIFQSRAILLFTFALPPTYLFVPYIGKFCSWRIVQLLISNYS